LPHGANEIQAIAVRQAHIGDKEEQWLPLERRQCNAAATA
jgi:hypothetical protein